MGDYKFAFDYTQLLMSIIGAGVAVSAGQPLAGIGTAMSGIEAARRIHENLPHKARPLARKIAKELEGRIKKLSNDDRALVMQMLEAGFPSLEEVVEANLNADAIIKRMISKLTDPDHKNLEIQGKFRRLVEPCLEDLLADKKFISEICPLILKSISETMNKISNKIDDMPEKIAENVIEKITENEKVPSDQLITFAYRCGIQNPDGRSEPELYALLHEKIDKWRSLEQQIGDTEIAPKEVYALHKAASQALRKWNYPLADQKFEEARNLVAKEKLQKPLEMNAILAEQQAETALLFGDAKHAYEILSDTADSFAGDDPFKSAVFRLKYGTQLYNHSKRYGGSGAHFSKNMLNRALERVTEKANGALHAALQVSLGNALSIQAEHMSGKEGRHLRNKAIEAYRKALSAWPREEHPDDWTGTLMNLGGALRREAERMEEASEEASQLLAEAVDLHYEVLSVWNQEKHPLYWAMTMGSLGNIIFSQAERMAGEAKFARVEKAIEAYRNALSIWTREEHPDDWAMTQANFAGALLLMAEGTKEEIRNARLAESIEALRSALNVWTRETHPLDWARVHENLGKVLFKQATTMKGEAANRWLTESIEAILEALTVFTREEYSRDWALANITLGCARGGQAEHSKGKKRKKLLEQAETAFTGALGVLSEEDDPMEWRTAHDNLAKARHSLSKH